MTWESSRPRPLSRPKSLGYTSSTIPNEALQKAGVEASSDLWRVENVYYPPAIREAALSSSEAGGVPEGDEATGTVATMVSTTPDEPAKESEPFGAAKIGEGLNLKAPPRAVESTTEAQASHAEEPTLLVEPLQAVPLDKGSRDLEITSTQLSEGGDKTKSKV